METVHYTLYVPVKTEAHKTEIKHLMEYHQVIGANDGYYQIFEEDIYCHLCQKSLTNVQGLGVIDELSTHLLLRNL